MLPNQLPINKVILASFAWTLIHWKKLLEISVLPLLMALPFLLILPDLLPLITTDFIQQTNASTALPDNLLAYMILFLYAYIALSIKVYRLLILDQNATAGFMPIIHFKQAMRFMALSLFIAVATTLPVLITGQFFIQFIMSFLLMPIVLNFINIAIDQPLKYKWNLALNTHFNLFLLQIIFPSMLMIAAQIIDFAPLHLALKIVAFYWTLISLALCYQIINDTAN